MRFRISIFSATLIALWFVPPAQAAGSMDKCTGSGFSTSCCSQANAKGLFAGDDTSSVASRWDFLGKCKAREEQKGKK
ncbi:hypothetical protein [Bradyrhizobium sp. LTSP857]|uniref:hypothetical protein n=1 Tax=Bradyrhizobium sp. LTSP857 TaxID=1619231 RepID=UPI000A575BA4|nr:hypothetical protein [Bradyrhizobium sp. LTSP857]